MKQRRYWVVSPNVTGRSGKNNDFSVETCAVASRSGRMAFMGWPPRKIPKDRKSQGPKFAGKKEPGVHEGDVILIGRRHDKRPQVIGCGFVKGPVMQHTIKGLEEWGPKSARRLPDFRELSSVPPGIPLMKCLLQTNALRQLHPKQKAHHEVVRKWLDKELRLTGPNGRKARGNGGQAGITPSQIQRGLEGEKEMIKRLKKGWRGLKLRSKGDHREKSSGYDFLCKRISDGQNIEVEVKTFAKNGRICLTKKEWSRAKKAKHRYWLVGVRDTGRSKKSWIAEPLPNPYPRLLEADPKVIEVPTYFVSADTIFPERRRASLAV